VHGIDCHIGSQITEATPYFDALERVLSLVSTLNQEGIAIDHLDLGGGLGIRYQDETPPSPADVAPKLLARIAQWATSGANGASGASAGGRSVPSVSFEPGRFIVGNAGVLLTHVEYLKTNEGKHFAIVDAAMNDLMRPAMYEAYHAIVPATPASAGTPVHNYDVVGPVCESGDWLGKNRDLALQQGQLLAILSAGAYGQSMASNYNSRGRAAEVLVDQGQATLIRRRESIDDLLQMELDVRGLG
jgi:diaminopimelate decarboxylase